MMRDVEIEALRNRMQQLAAEGRERNREAAAWLLADLKMREPVGFNRRPDADSHVSPKQTYR